MSSHILYNPAVLGHTCKQVVHLISEDMTIAQDHTFVMIGLVRNIEKFHLCFLERLVCLALVTRNTRSNNISPSVSASAALGLDVIPAKHPVVLCVDPAVSTHIAVTSEQSPVRKHDPLILPEIEPFTLDSNDAGSFKIAAGSILTNASAISRDDITHSPSNHVLGVISDSFVMGDPRTGRTRNV